MSRICTRPIGSVPYAHGWGINTHPTWTSSQGTTMYTAANDAAAVATLLDIGTRTVRAGYSVTQDSSGNVTADPSTRFKQWIANSAPSGIVTVPVLLPNTLASGITDEASGYVFGFKHGANAATALKGLVPYIELSNEIEAVPGNKCIISGSGNSAGNYSTAVFVIMRGILFGIIDGIRSVDRSVKLIGGGGTFAHYYFFTMLRNGTQPDGLQAANQRKMDWDETSWHWYINSSSTNDDPENMQGLNVLAAIAAWGKPIRITECGALWTGTAWAASETGVANAIVGNNLLARFMTPAIRAKYNIVQIFLYQLYDAATSPSNTTGDEMNYGLLDVNGNQKGRYATIKSFVASNPF